MCVSRKDARCRRARQQALDREQLGAWRVMAKVRVGWRDGILGVSRLAVDGSSQSMDGEVGWSSVSVAQVVPGARQGQWVVHYRCAAPHLHLAGGSTTRDLCFALVSAGWTAVNSI